jgi:Tfp pilus assembly major pilin PilA
MYYYYYYYNAQAAVHLYLSKAACKTIQGALLTTQAKRRCHISVGLAITMCYVEFALAFFALAFR